MDLWAIGLILIISVVLSFLLVPRLTAGSPVDEVPIADLTDRREMQPVVSQCGRSIPAIDQILEEDPDSVPGATAKIWSSDNLHFFDNTEIVDKLCGPGITEHTLDSWRNVEKDWQIKYGIKALETDMDKVKGIQNGIYASASKGKYFRPDTDYYHNPRDYCSKNPKFPKFPCLKSNLAPSSADMFIPGLN